MSDDGPIQRILDGTTWAEFCDTLKMAGETILHEDAPTDPQTRVVELAELKRGRS